MGEALAAGAQVYITGDISHGGIEVWGMAVWPDIMELKHILQNLWRNI